MDRILINCPECQATFELQLAREKQRVVRVRCSVCDHGWITRVKDALLAHDAICETIEPVEAASAPQPPPPDAVPALDLAAPPVLPPKEPRFTRTKPAFMPAHHKSERTRSPLPRSLACSFAAAMAFAFLFAKKDLIVAKVPAVAGLYASVGMPVNARGLNIRDVKSTLSEDNGQRILMVEGLIANVRETQTTVPDVRVSVRTSSGREVYHWVTQASKPQLAKGEIISFRARLIAAPEDGREIKVQFADKTESAKLPTKDPQKKNN